MSLDDDVDLFLALREKLNAKLDARKEELAAEMAKARDAQRRVNGRGRKGGEGAPGEGTQADRVLSWLREHPGPHGAAEIADATGLGRRVVTTALFNLHGARLLERPWRGAYTFAAPVVPALPAAAKIEEEPAQDPSRRETPGDRMRRVEEARKRGRL